MARPEKSGSRVLIEDADMSNLIGEDQLRDLLNRCTAEERSKLIFRIVRAWLGENPHDEVPLHDPDGLTYAYLVPAERRDQLVERTEEQYEARQQECREETGPAVPADELTRRLKQVPSTRSARQTRSA